MDRRNPLAMLMDTNRLPAWFRAAQMREFSGERMLWAGMPNPNTAMRGALVILLFAVPWTAFALFWEISVLRLWYFQLPNGKSGAPGFGLVLWGLPFVLIGFAMLSAPLFARRTARHTVHVLTDKRLVSLTQKRDLKVQSINLRAVTKITRQEKPDRSGTLTIELDSIRDSDGTSTRSETLHGIRDVHAVELLLREAMERAGK